MRRSKPAPLPEFFPGFTDITEIGTGSLATVYRARELGTNRLVALKLLNVRDASPRALESFERESVALGAVSSHPNIVTLYRSFRAADERPVLVLELCRGSVAERMSGGAGLPVADVVSLGVKIAGALETAHRAGILHRDVKPQNILMTEFGEPALADFGVAMLQSSTQTTAGLFDFTTLHAAPELLEGGDTSAATDVYELASTLYQLVAGRAAFRAYEGESPASVILRILRDPVQPLINTQAPASLSDLLLHAMSKDKGSRPPTAAEFAAGLAAVEIEQQWPRTQFLIRDADGGSSGLPTITRMPEFRRPSTAPPLSVSPPPPPPPTGRPLAGPPPAALVARPPVATPAVPRPAEAAEWSSPTVVRHEPDHETTRLPDAPATNERVIIERQVIERLVFEQRPAADDGWSDVSIVHVRREEPDDAGPLPSQLDTASPTADEPPAPAWTPPPAAEILDAAVPLPVGRETREVLLAGQFRDAGDAKGRPDAQSDVTEPVAAEQAAAERVQAERVEAERREAEQRESERREAERLEAERREVEQAEAARLQRERAQAERDAAERAAERAAAERADAERHDAERLEAERAAAERAEAERAAAERAEAERAAAERAEAERAAAERAEAERAAAERAEAARVQEERAQADRAAAERAEAERAAAERAESERAEAERAEAERGETQQAEAARVQGERAEAERVEAERAAAERAEAERAQPEQTDVPPVSAAPPAMGDTATALDAQPAQQPESAQQPEFAPEPERPVEPERQVGSERRTEPEPQAPSLPAAAPPADLASIWGDVAELAPPTSGVAPAPPPDPSTRIHESESGVTGAHPDVATESSASDPEAPLPFVPWRGAVAEPDPFETGEHRVDPAALAGAAPTADGPAKYPIPPSGVPTDSPLDGTGTVPTWAFRAATQAQADPGAYGDLALDPMSLRRKVTLRAGAASMVVDDAGLTSRARMKRSMIPWSEVLGFEPRYDEGGRDARMVVHTPDGPVELAATRRPVGEVRYIHALLDAYRQRAAILNSR